MTISTVVLYLYFYCLIIPGWNLSYDHTGQSRVDQAVSSSDSPNAFELSAAGNSPAATPSFCLSCYELVPTRSRQARLRLIDFAHRPKRQALSLCIPR